MKMNKKLVVPFLATIIGLSVAGGLGGAFAWYQFNSEVRTGFIGSSVADTGLLQMGYNDGSWHWGSSRYLPNSDLKPVTFGKMGTGNALPYDAGGDPLCYGYPEAGAQTGEDYTKGWKRMAVGDGYYQYEIYLRAIKANSAVTTRDEANDINAGYELSAQNVYISSVTLEDANNSGNKTVSDALRVHVDVDGGKKWLISKNEHSVTKATALDVHGYLDLDGDGHPDKYDADPWNTTFYNQDCKYGIWGDKQETTQAYDYTDNEHPENNITGIVQPRDTDGLMPASTDPALDPDGANPKCICKTKSTGNMADMVKVTITVWLEGWEALKVDNTTNKSVIWNPAMNAGVNVNVGLVFDVGRNILG